MDLDDSLPAFSEIDQQWSAILIGNGASRAISTTFDYKSLYDMACSGSVAHPIIDPEKAVFDALTTRNFEQVLAALSNAVMINGVYNLDSRNILSSYERIRIALVEAVHAVHTPFAEIPPDILHSIRKALLDYTFIYSTNYDLLLYWAIMQDPRHFKDYFFSGGLFDTGNVEVWDKSTRFLFLHGALHLYRIRGGGTYKRSAGAFGNLLDDFGSPIPELDGATPLFITEGSSSDKLRSIYTSDYLGFAYGQFMHNPGPLVIFGQSLEPQFDQHLISAIRGSGNRTLGIGIHAASTESVANRKAEWFTKFHNFDLHFFDATTHPLGSPGLAVAPIAAAAQKP